MLWGKPEVVQHVHGSWQTFGSVCGWRRCAGLTCVPDGHGISPHAKQSSQHLHTVVLAKHRPLHQHVAPPCLFLNIAQKT